MVFCFCMHIYIYTHMHIHYNIPFVHKYITPFDHSLLVCILIVLTGLDSALLRLSTLLPDTAFVQDIKVPAQGHRNYRLRIQAFTFAEFCRFRIQDVGLDVWRRIYYGTCKHAEPLSESLDARTGWPYPYETLIQTRRKPE